MMTAFRPSLQLLVRSTTKEQVFVIVSWEPRMCGGERVQLSRRSSNFVGQLFPQDEYRANLQPGGWIALVYPLGLTVDAATPEPPGSCESRFVVHARQGDRVEEIRFEVPLQPALVDGVDRVH